LDRIDLHIEVVPVPFALLSAGNTGDTSVQIRQRVMAAREMQRRRYEGQTPVTTYCNAQINGKLLRHFCRIEGRTELLLRKAMEKLNLSVRAHDHILKISRTIADLSGSEGIQAEHLAEAIQFRTLDREGWAA
jgi:magnesium chelatase family protein